MSNPAGDIVLGDAVTIGVDKAADDSQTMERSPEQWFTYWKEQIAWALREHKEYWAECAQVADAYRNAKSTKTGKRRRFNILFSNVETSRGAIFAKPGKPDVRQRWGGQDPVARAGSDLLESVLTTSIDSRGHETTMSNSVLNVLLAGRGVMRVDYEAKTETADLSHLFGQGEAGPSPMMGHNGGPIMGEMVTSQKVTKKSIRWSDFIHNPATCWDEVWWVAYRVRMTREDMKANGFKNWQTIKLNWVPKNEKGEADHQSSDHVRRCEMWEVWSKTHKKRFWVPLDHDTIPRIDDDPYGLEGFFNCPEPLQFHTLNNAIPVLDYWQYEALAVDLEEVHNRIAKLTEALKRRGVRDKAIKELAKLAQAQDNQLVEVESWQHLMQKGGLKGVFELEDIEPVAKVLTHLIQIGQHIEDKIDRMTGIADIMRGETAASETATAQNIKAQYGGIRLKLKQREVQRFMRDAMRIEAELVAEHFEPYILAEMTGKEVPDEVLQILRDNKTRGFRIDVETDSTIMEDTAGEKEALSETVSTALSLMEKGTMAAQSAPELGELNFELLSMLLRTMKGGRSIEDSIDRAKEQMRARMQQQQQAGPPPDPEMAKVELEKEKFAAQQQADQAAMQMKAQSDQQAMMMKAEADERKAASDMAATKEIETMKAHLSAEAEKLKGDITLAVEQMRLQHQREIESLKLDLEREKAQADTVLRREELEMKEIEGRYKVHLEREKLANDNYHRDGDREVNERHGFEKIAADERKAKLTAKAKAKTKPKVQAAE